MKIILDFDKPKKVKISASDDETRWYRLFWNGEKCSLWYNDKEFVWERAYDNLSWVIGELLASMLHAMEKREEVEL